MSTTLDKPVATGPANNPDDNPLAMAMKICLKGIKALASLQLTVVLFAFSIALVFFGTLAQRDNGIWTVVDEYFWSWIVMVRFDLIHQFGSVFFDMSKDTQWSGSFPLPGGKLLGGAMVINLLAAHALRFRLTWKRSGILLIHSGLFLLFLGEFITREYAVEQQMSIDEGQSVSYSRDSRHYELAFVNRSDPKADAVTVIPASRLKDGEGRITHPDLPVDVQVRKWMANTRSADPAKKNPATAGLAANPRTELNLVEAPEVSGVDSSQMVDLPAAYVTLFKKGTDQELGTYLVALRYALQDLNNKVEVDGKPFEFQLRNVRYYKPYRVELIQFRFDRYPGTNKPRNYSSEVIVYDQSGAKVREQLIRMNEPMRFEGETFYQQGFNQSETGTILQIVRNPGWVLPYVSCAVVGFGLVLHFMIVLIGFLTKMRRTAVKPPVDPASPPEATEKFGEPTDTRGWFQRNFEWFIPTVITAACVLYLLGVYGRMKPKDNFDLDTFSRLPVLEGGRVKPLDSVARVYLRKISHRSVLEDENGDEHPAIRWYLDTLGAKPTDEKALAWNYKVVRIESDQILSELKLKRREGVRYSVNELRPHFGTIAKNSDKARKKRASKQTLDPVEAQYIDLNDKIGLLIHVAQGKGNDLDGNVFHLVPPQADGESWLSYGEFRDRADDAAFAKALADARARVHAQPGGFDQVAKDFLLQKMLGQNGVGQVPPERQQTLLDMVMKSPPVQLPPDARTEIYDLVLGLLPQNEQNEQRAAYEADRKNRENANPGIAAWTQMIDLHSQKKFGEFNSAVTEYRDKYTSQISKEDLKHSSVEITYNRFAPFLRCIGLYVIAFILSAVGFAFKAVEWAKLGEALRRSSVYVLLLAFVVHMAGLFVRMDLMNYTLVFVTNLYSSAIFIGAGCVGLGLVLERVFPIGIGAVVASVLGVATTIVAHNLATEDTLEMMQAVLDTNFWLATHVTTVTLGYTATFVAGFLGAAYLFLMFCSVVRDSFRTPGTPTPGGLLAYGGAAFGIVFLPLSVGWVLFDALAKFELIPGILGELLRYGMVAVGGLYFLILLASRAGAEGLDSHGKAVAPAMPRAAKPIVAMGLTDELSKVLRQMIYGVVCFATVLSFIGTVLGGIWADQSWGRFWGWDPKENGAVLIVLWNALLLHARWCGLVKVRGMAVLAVIGNIITAWSWFGTNQLEYGLHAYGRNTTLADACANFWISMTALAAIGLIPQRFWSTAAAAPATAVSVSPPKGKPGRKK